MGTNYEISGHVLVVDTIESRVAVTALDDFLSGFEGDVDIQYVSKCGKKQIYICLSISDYMSYSSASEIDELIENVGAYAIVGAMFDSECDGDRNELWVGKDRMMIRRAQSAHAIEKIKTLTYSLLPEDGKKLFDIARKFKSKAKENKKKCQKTPTA